MRKAWERFKSEWRIILVQAVLTTVILIGAAWTISAVAGAQDAEKRTDKATQVIVQQVQETQELICALLKGADDPQIRKAWSDFCAPA